MTLAVALVTGGCVGAAARRPPPPPAPASADSAAEDRDTVSAVLMGNTLQTMQRMAQSGPAEQAEILASARDAYLRAPHGTVKLRYALMLATPAHPARDPVMAQKQLRELAAQPETLQPLERAVALIELAQLDRELALKADSQRLAQNDEPRAERERGAATQRRLQAEIDENARLRRQLEDAQAKLDAIANIERNLTQRKPGTDGEPP